MKSRFNVFQRELSKWQHHEAKRLTQNGAEPPSAIDQKPKERNLRLCHGASEKVVGGDILWKPVNRAAAMLLAKAPWWAHVIPTQQTPPTQPKQKKRRTHKMKEERSETQLKGVPNSNYVSEKGLEVRMVNGEPMFRVTDVQALICREIDALPKETTPLVRSAQDARRIVDELCQGLGRDFEQFRTSTKMYLEDIRQTRFAVVTETSQMTTQLKELRQFFIGSDYKEQIERLREFVALCERLQKLKESGFLHSVADTMLRLAVRE